MSTEIVTDICPPPEWNLTEEDIHQMVDENIAIRPHALLGNVPPYQYVPKQP